MQNHTTPAIGYLNQLQLLAETLPFGVASFDRQMKCVMANERWLADYGLEKVETLGKPYSDLFPEVAETWEALHWRGLAGGNVTKHGKGPQSAPGPARRANAEKEPPLYASASQD